MRKGIFLSSNVSSAVVVCICFVASSHLLPRTKNILLLCKELSVATHATMCCHASNQLLLCMHLKATTKQRPVLQQVGGKTCSKFLTTTKHSHQQRSSRKQGTASRCARAGAQRCHSNNDAMGFGT